MTQYFCWTSYSVEADSREKALEQFIDAVKEKMADVVIEEESA